MIRGKERFLSRLYGTTDFIVIQVSFLIAWFVKFVWLLPENVGYLPIENYFFWSFIYGSGTVLFGFVFALYSPKRKNKFINELSKILQVHIMSMFMLLSLLYLFRVVDLSRSFLFLYFLISLIVVIIYRYVIKKSLHYVRKRGYNKQFVLIVGAGTLGKRYFKTLDAHPEYGLEVVGFLDDGQFSIGQDKPLLGSLIDLEEVLSSKTIDEVVITLPLAAYEKYQSIIAASEAAGVRTTIIPDYYDVLPATPHFEVFGDLPVINVRDVPLDEMHNRIVKRAFDITFSIVAIIVTSPLLILIAILIKITSPGPIIFKQERVGLNKRTFYMYKFRSMKQMSEEESNTLWTVENDPRRTKLGEFLRKTSLDELPQFFNVFLGDMSVVGPRPERPFFVEQFKEEIPKYMVKHLVRPGITGWAQVSGLRGDTSIKDRIQHDIYYIENWALLFDLRIIIKTFINGFINKNAY